MSQQSIKMSLSMMSFYKLEHIRYYKDNDFSDQKIIGVYSSEDLAKKKKKEYENKEGFRHHKEGFSIQELKLNARKFQQKNFYWILQSIEPYADKYHDFIRTIGLFWTKKEADESKKKIKISKSEGKKIYVWKFVADRDSWVEWFIDD